MRIAAIAAMDQNGLIGANGKLPWHLPEDLRRFRTLTWGKPVIMGRRTFESLKGPLHGRLNIVLTHQHDWQPPVGCQRVGSLTEAVTRATFYCHRTGEYEAMVIGGGTVYRATLPFWGRLYLTIVAGQFSGDTYLPLAEICQMRWRIVSDAARYDSEPVIPTYSFLILDRVSDPAAPCDNLTEILGLCPNTSKV